MTAGMSRAFRNVGLDPFDRLDLIARHGGKGRRGAIAGLLSRLPVLKRPYFLYARLRALYGVKR